MKKREYSWQSPLDCPTCKVPLHIRSVIWFTPYEYLYLFQCKLCPEEATGRTTTEFEYVPFWEEPEEPKLAPAPLKRAKRIEKEE